MSAIDTCWACWRESCAAPGICTTNAVCRPSFPFRERKFASVMVAPEDVITLQAAVGLAVGAAVGTGAGAAVGTGAGADVMM